MHPRALVRLPVRSLFPLPPSPTRLALSPEQRQRRGRPPRLPPRARVIRVDVSLPPRHPPRVPVCLRRPRYSLSS